MKRHVAVRFPNAASQKAYWIHADSDRATELEDALDRSGLVRTQTQHARVQWMAQTSRFYAAASEALHGGAANFPPEPSEVRPVSHRETATTDARNSPAINQARFWKQLAQKCDRWLDDQALRSTSQKQTSSEPIVALGESFESGWTAFSWGWATLVGLMASGLAIVSGQVWPRRIWMVAEEDRQQASRIGTDAEPPCSALAIDLPAEWIGVKQPAGVYGRRLVGWVFVASAMAVTLWELV